MYTCDMLSLQLGFNSGPAALFTKCVGSGCNYNFHSSCLQVTWLLRKGVGKTRQILPSGPADPIHREGVMVSSENECLLTTKALRQGAKVTSWVRCNSNMCDACLGHSSQHLREEASSLWRPPSPFSSLKDVGGGTNVLAQPWTQCKQINMLKILVYRPIVYYY